MCFSASASFTASAGLFIIGAITIYKSKTGPQRLLASIPFIFSIQQFSEGMLWISLCNTTYATWYNIAMYVFLLFAQVVWPSFVPFTILLMEKEPRRRKIIRWLLGAGLLTSAYLLYCLCFYEVRATLEAHHIKYDLHYPDTFRWISGLTYILAAVCSPFISSVKGVRLLGVILLASYLFTRLFYRDYLISVWCYFAAVLSLFILAIIIHLNKHTNLTGDRKIN